MANGRRWRFGLALGLFAGWVVVLGVLAWRSGDPPRPQPAPSAPATVPR